MDRIEKVARDALKLARECAAEVVPWHTGEWQPDDVAIRIALAMHARLTAERDEARANSSFLPRDAAQAVASQLVSARRWGDVTYINLPIIMPSGSAATVRIFAASGGYRVDDGGFAYRELESVGAEKRFTRTARKLAEPLGLAVNSRTISTIVEEGWLFGAVCDVGIASRDVVERVFSRLGGEEEIEATPPETPDERQAAIVRALRADAHCCDCFAYSDDECACGARGGEPDECSFKQKYVEDIADWIESGEWRK